MRYISFMLTTDQIRNRTKTVTRRVGWNWLVGACRRGESPILQGCFKCQGLKLGEHPEKLTQIKVVSARFESLDDMLIEPYGSNEAILEGFPGKSGAWFVKMFIDHTKGLPSQIVTRIAFEYLDPQS